MAALSSYHNILMMNQAASKSVVTLLTQGFLPCRGPRGGAGSSEKAFVLHCYLFIKSSAVPHLLLPSPFPSRVNRVITREGIYSSDSTIPPKQKFTTLQHSISGISLWSHQMFLFNWELTNCLPLSIVKVFICINFYFFIVCTLWPDFYQLQLLQETGLHSYGSVENPLCRPRLTTVCFRAAGYCHLLSDKWVVLSSLGNFYDCDAVTEAVQILCLIKRFNN